MATTIVAAITTVAVAAAAAASSFSNYLKKGLRLKPQPFLLLIVVFIIQLSLSAFF